MSIKAFFQFPFFAAALVAFGIALCIALAGFIVCVALVTISQLLINAGEAIE